MFHGSYAPGEVTFLLKHLALQPIEDVREKERLIQSGRRHYSEVVGIERKPTPEYLQLFEQAVAGNARQVAQDLLRLAAKIRRARPGGVTLISLARAGTPIGILLRHALADHLGCEAAHYSVSIIRDRGLDLNALRYILERHPAESVVFVDGWTGKGVIASELQRSLAQFNQGRAAPVPDDLYVLCDLCGHARDCGSAEDYLIPSAVLNATVSGLVSRSILNEQIGPADFHGCLYFPELQAEDRSRWFVDRIREAMAAQPPGLDAAPLGEAERQARRERSRALVQDLMARYAIGDPNYIKPGIGEATRSLLRRVPRLLILRDADLPEVRHLVLLARERGVPVEPIPQLPLKAVSIIQKLSDA
ncbi:hypothetical protein D0B54_01785 [Solimonas sp. K1W22B-7]|uniref:cysteine protease StiP family protein n=1 Tax=Solimonas sp. K1W22B-7 TaxID=2303331 RepID=UPI000E32FA0E|nr:cysteine protease StiP family protein [Solimonas sp. K1W22B-7]AXQ27489.1 hypothetical protein D0B54_01785 [Solimonas sp. K1W22B-7]